MNNRRNYYRILHVQPDAPLEIIKSSYRTLLLKLKKHPDLGGDQWESTLLNEAKEVLTDPKKRSEYDRDFLKEYTWSRHSESHCASEPIDPSVSAGVNTDCTGAAFSRACRFCHKLEQRPVFLSPGTRCTSCHSPLYPTHKIKNPFLKKRAFQRIAKDFSIIYYIEWPAVQEYHGQTTQLSPTGMQFCADQSLEPDQIIKINSRYIEAVARIVHCLYSSFSINRPSPAYIIGVEFLAFVSLMAPGTFVSQKT